MASNFIILIIAFLFLGAFTIPLINKFGKKIRNSYILLILALINVFAILLYKEIIFKGSIIYSVGAKIPSLASIQGLPVRIILTADALSGFLTLLFVFITSLVFLYSIQTLKEHFSIDKFYILSFLLLTGILGFLFTGDFFTLFVFYEINTIATAGLIAFFRNRESLKSSFNYLIVFAIGSLFLLLGIGFLYGKYGALNMAIIANNLDFLLLDKIALVFIISALLLKAGAFPFYFWKPQIYKATPIPAIILSMMSSLAALYVLFKIVFNVLGYNMALGWTLVLFSVISIFAGVFFALKEKSIKRILAYLAISELGYIILGISAGMIMASSEFGFMAIKGGLFHMVNDILDISFLFLIVGVIFYISKAKNIFEIQGIGHKHPFLSGLFFFGVLAVAGMPPLNGFASKIIIYESIFHLSPVLTILGIMGSILTLAVLIKVFAMIFLGTPSDDLEKYRKIPKLAVSIIIIFAVAMLLIGLFPKEFTNAFIDKSASSLVDRQNYIRKIIH
ncbi:MAG: proton-conducting transporter membrane subunit [Patescibacteria group bacterium]|nr:proton-conducting transporter membrane subunit [Patescibacteria group bacterium]